MAWLCFVGTKTANAAVLTTPTQGESGAGKPLVSLDDDDDKWIDEFLRILRELYAILGGDPAKLGTKPNQAMSQVTSYFVLNGVPGNLTPSQISEAQSDIATMTTMLLSPPSSVTPGIFPLILSEILALL